MNKRLHDHFPVQSLQHIRCSSLSNTRQERSTWCFNNKIWHKDCSVSIWKILSVLGLSTHNLPRRWTAHFEVVTWFTNRKRIKTDQLHANKYHNVLGRSLTNKRACSSEGSKVQIPNNIPLQICSLTNNEASPTTQGLCSMIKPC